MSTRYLKLLRIIPIFCIALCEIICGECVFESRANNCEIIRLINNIVILLNDKYSTDEVVKILNDGRVCNYDLQTLVVVINDILKNENARSVIVSILTNKIKSEKYNEIERYFARKNQKALLKKVIFLIKFVVISAIIIAICFYGYKYVHHLKELLNKLINFFKIKLPFGSQPSIASGKSGLGSGASESYTEPRSEFQSEKVGHSMPEPVSEIECDVNKEPDSTDKKIVDQEVDCHDVRETDCLAVVPLSRDTLTLPKVWNKGLFVHDKLLEKMIRGQLTTARLLGLIPSDVHAPTSWPKGGLRVNRWFKDLIAEQLIFAKSIGLEPVELLQ